jgi:hypothetical protein
MTAHPSGTMPSGADPTPRSTRHWIHRWFVFLIVGFAGFCSLVYQVVWERTLKYNFGGDSVSAAIVTATFLLGLGIGAVAFGRATAAIRGVRARRTRPRHVCHRQLPSVSWYGQHDVGTSRSPASAAYWKASRRLPPQPEDHPLPSRERVTASSTRRARRPPVRRRPRLSAACSPARGRLRGPLRRPRAPLPGRSAPSLTAATGCSRPVAGDKKHALERLRS